VREKNRLYRQRNAAKRAKQDRLYRKRNPESYRERQRLSYQRHWRERRDQQSIYYLRYRKRILERSLPYKRLRRAAERRSRSAALSIQLLVLSSALGEHSER
jgi:hypothetical protein